MKDREIRTWVAGIHRSLENLTANSARGVVAVSGGADSVALLRVLSTYPDIELVVAHLNHQLRGVDSDRDAAFVESLCPQWPHFIEAANIASLANETSENLEATARRERYAFLRRVAHRTGATWVATAHTLDDQAETVLHRLIRGAGLRGLRGILPCRPLDDGVNLIRPMLTASRREVIQYLQGIGQVWCEDASNADPQYTRNRIRHDLLPLLRTFNTEVSNSLARLANQAEEVYIDLEMDAIRLLTGVELPRVDGIIVLRRKEVASARAGLVSELFHQLWKREGWNEGEMSSDLWAKVESVARGDRPAWDLPAGIRIEANSHVIRVGPSEQMH
jgi:tRNA(Ile)-lysidine synthase